ncbi:hypothetical protein HYQ46_001896 [Verticillium longisporum]|nr:hypothetical protein HYQ46_001896 [Verticillium longisporum]
MPSGQSQQPWDNRGFTGNTIKPHSRDNSNAVTPTADRMGPPPQRTRGPQYLHNPSNLRVATDVPISYVNGNGNGGNRTATLTSATPRSGESFSSNVSSNRGISDFTDDDRYFEKIFLILRRSSDLVMRTLPMFQSQLANGARIAAGQRALEDEIRRWKGLIQECGRTIQQAELLKNRLSLIKLKEPGVMGQSSFRSLIKSFVNAWAEFATEVKYASPVVPLPGDTRTRLRPIHQAMKETSDTILSSPWGSMLSHTGGTHSSSSSTIFSPGSHQLNNPPYQMPMTPQSAALGPAVQATVPSTPQSASFAAAFNGNVFERADALISMGGISMSRNNTLLSNHGNHSFSSMTSLASDGYMTPSSAISPGGFGPGPYHSHSRLNGSKVAF